MTKRTPHERLNLRLFDAGGGEGGAAAAPAAPAAGEDGAQASPSGVQRANADTPGGPPPPPEDRQAAFERLIREEYKAEFAARTQAIIDKRFKETKQIEAAAEGARPILERLARRYGTPQGDFARLAEALEADGEEEAEADGMGISVTQLRDLRRMEKANESLRTELKERGRRAEADRTYAVWLRQAEALGETYPGFDLREECRDGRFLGLLRGGADIRTAFEALHHREILDGTIRAVARDVSRRVTDGIRARGARPMENGVSGQSPAVLRPSVEGMSREKRDEIERRAMRGEHIRL